MADIWQSRDVFRSRPRQCPLCGGSGIPIAYGLPDPDLFRQAERGDVVIGGCIVEDYSPDFRCQSCGHAWIKTSRSTEVQSQGSLGLY